MKIKNIYIAGLLFIFSFMSCQKYLNLAPENNTYDEVFWRDANNISKAVAGGYSLFRDALRNERSFFVYGDIVGGNFNPGNDFWFYSSLRKSAGFNLGAISAASPNLWDWTRFYGVINQCNLIIENTLKLPAANFAHGESDKNSLLGQAYFLRAYTNFYMQRVWGDILLVTESFKDPRNILSIARSPQEETLKLCVDDLKYAIEHVGDAGSKGFASKDAAKALLTHIYAWNHDYINVELLATEIINSGNYSLESIENYLNIWKGNSQETIFEIPMLYAESGNEFNTYFFDIFLADPYIKNKTISSAWAVDNVIIEDYFDEPEKRFGLIIDFNNYLLKYSEVKYYDVSDQDLYTVSNNLVLLRLADIYLLRAEAYFNNQKGALALGDLNRIRIRAGLMPISSSGDNLFFEIFRERRREFVGEGSMQFDLIRMNLLDKLAEFNIYYSQDRIKNQGYYWPLDMKTLFPQDQLLTQNPWWITN